VRQLNVLDLVPGSKRIRLTIFSQNAIEKLKEVRPVKSGVSEMGPHE
jgi:hypothetical protein